MFASIHRLRGRILEFRRSRDGNVLVMFAMVLPAMLLSVLALVDYSRAATQRLELQNSLDSATLYAARSTATTETELTAIGMRVLRANLQGSGVSLGAVSFRMDANQRVYGSAQALVPVTAPGIIGVSQVTIGSTSEVARSSNNVEVAIALDVTGSMRGTPLADMKSAAKELVDLIVKDVQTPHYTKVALVPYSNAVNVGSLANSVRGTLTAGRCDTPGCERYRFYNASNERITYDASTCVTERTGSDAYTDVAPNLPPTRVGQHYIGAQSGDGNLCIASQIVPLSTNRASLKASIDAYSAEGSTAGQIGLAWAWYMVSPNFASLFPASSQAAAYNSRDLLKVVILMTDGEFNTAHANGVLSRDSGFGSNAIQINQNATNGSAHNQALTLCGRIKSSGVILYTVGFNLNSNNARNLMRDCATSATHAYLPNGGVALSDAFRAIGQEINSLRIAR